jgi:hypothetical protein
MNCGVSEPGRQRVEVQQAQPPEVQITAERLPDARRFAVRDNGIGSESQYFDCGAGSPHECFFFM